MFIYTCAMYNRIVPVIECCATEVSPAWLTHRCDIIEPESAGAVCDQHGPRRRGALRSLVLDGPVQESCLAPFFQFTLFQVTRMNPCLYERRKFQKSSSKLNLGVTILGSFPPRPGNFFITLSNHSMRMFARPTRSVCGSNCIR
jgi:hypothetical protein